MRSLKRLNFVMRQEPYHASDAEPDLSMDADSATGGSGGSRAAGDSNGPALVTPVIEAVAREMEPEPLISRRQPLGGMREASSRRKWFVTGDRENPKLRGIKKEANRDKEITDRIVSLVRDLNESMDDAVRNGLIVEPILTRIKGRYGNVDEEGGYMLSLKLFRKLC